MLSTSEIMNFTKLHVHLSFFFVFFLCFWLEGMSQSTYLFIFHIACAAEKKRKAGDTPTTHWVTEIA